MGLKKLKHAFSQTATIIFLLVLYGFISGFTANYFSPIITTLEKRFDFTSAQMGLIKSAANIGYMTCVVGIAYLSSEINKMLIVFAACILYAISCGILMLPYLILGPKYTPKDLMEFYGDASKNMSMSGSEEFLCRALPNITGMWNLEQSSFSSRMDYERQVCYALLAVGYGLQGVAQCPFWSIGIAMIDDLAGKRSGICIGILSFMRNLTPVICNLFTSWLVVQHESFSMTINEFGDDESHPKWIGAWWFGYVISFVLFLALSPLLFLAKDRFSRKSVPNVGNKKSKEENSFLNSNNQRKSTTIDRRKSSVVNPPEMRKIKKLGIKEFITVMKCLWTNPIFLSKIIGVFFWFIASFAMFSFYMKYLEVTFSLTASRANTLASSTEIASLLGLLISTFISYRHLQSIRSKNLLILTCSSLAALVNIFVLIFVCQPSQFQAPLTGSNLTNSENCSLSCNCNSTNYSPVCMNETNYLSPCHAGCSQLLNSSVYASCGCNQDMVATRGVCEGECHMIYAHLSVMFASNFFLSLYGVQGMQVFMQLLNPKYKALSLAFISFIFSVIEITIPPLAGSIWDSGCITKDSVNGDRCIRYDILKLHYLLNGISLAGLSIWSFCSVIAWYASPKDDEIFDDDQEDERKELDNAESAL